jgi:hypothetical protein
MQNIKLHHGLFNYTSLHDDLWDSLGIALPFLTLTLCGQLHDSVALTAEKAPSVPIG